VVTVTCSADSGFIYLNIHLDYGLKGTVGLAKGGPSGNDPSVSHWLVWCPTDTITVLGSGAQTDSDGVCNMNVFRKPGVEVARANATNSMHERYHREPNPQPLKDAGHGSDTGKTDEDGWYMLPYKWTGKARHSTHARTVAKRSNQEHHAQGQRLRGSELRLP